MDGIALNQALGKLLIVGSVQDAVLNALWGASMNSKSLKIDMSPYMAYYDKRVRRFLLEAPIPRSLLHNHSDLIRITEKLLSRRTREIIHQEIASRLVQVPSWAEIDYAIDLCASLLVMADIELHKNVNGLSGCTTVHWKENSLECALGDHFSPQMFLRADDSKLGKLFTARNLSRIGGMTIKWTTNLADHLRFVDDDHTVFIFHCASFLQFQESLIDDLFPESFLRETLDTLALLCPSDDRETQQWLQVQPSIDAKLGKCGTLRASQRRLDRYSFWHDRLVIIKQVFDESQPKTLSQWWFDRRNGVQWYTFWVAILVFAVTVFFGVLQTVTGVMQVYIAYKALPQG